MTPNIWLQIFTFFASLLKWILDNKAKNSKNFESFLDVMDKKGLTAVQLRLGAEEQRDDIAEQWEEEEKNKEKQIHEN